MLDKRIDNLTVVFLNVVEIFLFDLVQLLWDWVSECLRKHPAVAFQIIILCSKRYLGIQFCDKFIDSTPQNTQALKDEII